MCFICWGVAGAGLAAAAIDKKYNESKMTNFVKERVFNKNTKKSH